MRLPRDLLFKAGSVVREVPPFLFFSRVRYVKLFVLELEKI